VLYGWIGIVPALNFLRRGREAQGCVPLPSLPPTNRTRLPVSWVANLDKNVAPSTHGARRKASISARRCVVVTLITDEVASRISIGNADMRLMLIPTQMRFGRAIAARSQVLVGGR
jgi:hypothetical protein